MIRKYLLFYNLFSLSFLIFGVFLQFVPFNAVFHNFFADSYYYVAFLGFIGGLLSSKSWSGRKNSIGLPLLIFSIGLLFEFIGQLYNSIIYVFYDIDLLFPSISDLFFLLGSMLYAFGAHLFNKNIKIKFKQYYFLVYIASFLLSLICMYLYTVWFSLSLDSHSLLTYIVVALYTFVQISMVILTFIFFTSSSTLIDGELSSLIRLLFISSTIHLVADIYFIYEALSLSWAPGGLSDMLYLIAYYLIGLSALLLGTKYYREHKFIYVPYSSASLN